MKKGYGMSIECRLIGTQEKALKGKQEGSNNSDRPRTGRVDGVV